MNYECERQNQWHFSENCTGTGVTMNDDHKTENNGPLKLNYAHMRAINAHFTRGINGHIRS